MFFFLNIILNALISVVPIEKTEDNEQISVLDVGGHPKKINPGKTHAFR